MSPSQFEEIFGVPTVGFRFSHARFGGWGHRELHVCVCVCVRCPEAILISGKVFKHLQTDLRTSQDTVVSISKQPGVFSVCLDLVNFHCGQRCSAFSFQPNSLQVA